MTFLEVQYSFVVVLAALTFVYLAAPKFNGGYVRALLKITGITYLLVTIGYGVWLAWSYSLNPPPLPERDLPVH